jgi:hypothetical protein
MTIQDLIDQCDSAERDTDGRRAIEARLIKAIGLGKAVVDDRGRVWAVAFNGIEEECVWVFDPVRPAPGVEVPEINPS